MIGVGRDGPLGPLGAADDKTRGVASSGGAAERPGVPGPRRSADEAVAIDELADHEAWAILASVIGLGPIKMGALVRSAGSAPAVLALARRRSGARRLGQIRVGRDPIGVELADAIGLAPTTARPLLDRLRSGELVALILADEAYPPRLRAIEVPPPVLFVQGSVAALDDVRSVAVVGTRRPTERGRQIAARIGTALARAGAAVISGLAVGIDGATHEAVVVAGGRTVAVLGSGHDRLYPRAHTRLADRILETGGAIVSELPPAMSASSWTFPQRNRIISGLADATVVVEAGETSGALITAAWALEQGRDCYLVPGSIEDPRSAGCLAFLRDQASLARIVASVPDLLDDLGFISGKHTARRAAATVIELGTVERQVAEAIRAGLGTVDALAAATGLPVGTILGAVTMLETRGLVVDVYGRYRAIGDLGDQPARRHGRPSRGAGPSGGGHSDDEPTRSAA